MVIRVVIGVVIRAVIIVVIRAVAIDSGAGAVLRSGPVFLVAWLVR